MCVCVCSKMFFRQDGKVSLCLYTTIASSIKFVCVVKMTRWLESSDLTLHSNFIKNSTTNWCVCVLACARLCVV